MNRIVTRRAIGAALAAFVATLVLAIPVGRPNPRLAAATPAVAPAAGLEAAYDARRKELLTAGQAALFPRDDVKFRAYDTLAWTAVHGCGPSSMVDGMVGVVDPAQLAKSIDKAAFAFVLPPLVRYMIQYHQCLSPAQLARIRAYLAQPQPLFTHGTLNHAMMTATSYYLLAEQFPDQAWKNGTNNPFNSAQVIARYHDLLLGRFRGSMVNGFNEQLSPTYSTVNFLPLLNLIDFARDPQIRKAAEVMATAQMAMLRADSLDYAILPPFAREVAIATEQSTQPSTYIEDLLWLMYGPAKRPPGVPREPAYSAMLALSAWHPPVQLLALQSPADFPYELTTRTPAFSEWAASGAPESFGSTLIARDFAIGSGEVAIGPGVAKTVGVPFGIFVRNVMPVGLTECGAPEPHPGPVQPPWNGDRLSPFQQAVRVGAEGVLLYALPGPAAAGPALAGGPDRRVRCRFPAQADETVEKNNLLLQRFGQTVVALRFFGGTAAYEPPANGFGMLSFSGGRIGIYYHVWTLGAGQTLASAATALAQAPIAFDPAGPMLSFRSAAGHAVRVRFGPGADMGGGRIASLAQATIDGQPVAPPNAMVIRSPIFAMGGGRFTMHTSAGTLNGAITAAGATLTP